VGHSEDSGVLLCVLPFLLGFGKLAEEQPGAPVVGCLPREQPRKRTGTVCILCSQCPLACLQQPINLFRGQVLFWTLHLSVCLALS
jgi:hypothetical protein